MVWVRSEYAGELAVLSAWISALLPWSVSFIQGESLQIVVIRFLPFRFQFLYGLELAGEQPFLWVWQTPGFNGPSALYQMSWSWIAGAAVYLVPLGLSVAYYGAEQRVEDLPVDPVRLMGGLLGLSALVMTVATAFLYLGQSSSVPFGVLFMWLFAYLLLRVERT
jgi:uncharacterized protein (TIGR04206 family)